MNYVSRALIKKKEYLTEDTIELHLKPELRIKYNPGSFLQLTLEEVTASEVWPESRTFSIASYDFNSIRIIVKLQGEYTHRIFNESRLDKIVTIKYPFGDLYTKSNDHKSHVFIAGGVGITPFIGLAEYFDQIANYDTYLFYSSKKVKSLLFIDYLKKKIGNVKLFTTQELNKLSMNRRIEIKDILSIEAINKDTCFYISGSNNFISSYQSQLKKLGFSQIFYDQWE